MSLLTQLRKAVLANRGQKVCFLAPVDAQAFRRDTANGEVVDAPYLRCPEPPMPGPICNFDGAWLYEDANQKPGEFRFETEDSCATRS